MDKLKRELDALAFYIRRVREEVAAIDRPADENHGFQTMGEQMDAIVRATELATDAIMSAAERNDEAVEKLRKLTKDPFQVSLLDEIAKNDSDIVESCSFQDITGQRVSKVAKSLTYVEERVATLMQLMGAEQVAKIEVQPIGQKTEDEKLINGPQIEGRGLMQSDIDKLFA